MTPQAQLLFSLRHYKLHPLLAALVGGYLIYFAVSLFKSRRDAWVRRWAAAVTGLVLAQVCVGLANAAPVLPKAQVAM